MKKYLLALMILVLGVAPAFSVEAFDPVVSDPQDVIYQSSMTDMVKFLDDEDEIYDDNRVMREIDPYKMPFFKQMRLKMTNKYIESTAKPKEVKLQTFFSKLKFWDKDTSKVADEIQGAILPEGQKSEIEQVIDATANIETSDSVLLDGGVNEEQVEKQLMLDASNINFDDETGDMIATGRPILFLPPQNTKIIADKMQYNDDGNILKAIGNVVVIKDGKPIHSDYLEINMNEETLDVDNILAKFPKMNISAEHALQQEGLVILNKGSMYSENSYIYRLMSRAAGPNLRDMILDEDAEALFFGDPENHEFKVKMSYLEIDAGKNHDVIKVKDLKITHNDKVFFKWPHLTMYTNKEHQYFEGNYPEFGSRRKMGAFLGPGFAFKGPFGSVMKIVPFINYRSSEFGFGGLLKYINTYNRTELGYGSANDIFFLKGRQRLDDNLTFQYGYNSFMNEWFLGGRMPKYIAELNYDKGYKHKNFLGEKLDLTFRQRASFGFMKDDDRNFNGEKFNNATNMSTTRTRYMAEIGQTLYSYKDKKNRFQLSADVLMQGSAALYGTGDTQFVARIGPRLKIQYKNWYQDLSYYLSGYDDKTPLPHFDAYRYGKSSVRLVEAFRITKYLTFAWSGYANLSDDAPNGKTLQENAFLFSIGPDDFKVVLGYDFIRDRTYFGFNVAFDPKGTTVNYDKMVIKNPERLGKHADRDEHKVSYVPVGQDESSPQKSFVGKSKDVKPLLLKYAEVIEIEDPDKERIE